MSTDELQQILIAAEYLDDDATLARASEALARVLFPASLPTAPPSGGGPARQHSERSAAAGTVVEALPEHLAITTLRAAFAAVPLCVTCSAVAVTDAPHADARARRMHAVLALLPEPLRPLALRAADPAVDSRRSLTLHHVDAPAAAAVLRCAGASLGTHLTALSLTATATDPESGWCIADDVARALEDVAPLLPQLEGLEQLQVRITDRCLVPACVHAVAGALPGMPYLTHLEVSGFVAGALGLQGLSQSLPALRMLRTLGLERGGAGGDLPDVKALAAALRTLRALTRLSLAHNSLAGGRWEALAPAAAALPLQSLDLRRCSLEDDFDLFYRCDRATSRPLHELHELDLSLNCFRRPRAEYISRLPALKRLDMALPYLEAEGEGQVVQALLDNESADLEVLKLGWGYGRPAATGALCRGLSRWSRLRAVTLSLRRRPSHEALPELAPRLAALPNLRELHLGYASVQSSGDAPEALGQLRALTRLELPYLRCSLEGAVALTRRIAALTQLCSVAIRLGGGECEGGSGAVLVRGLAALTRLTYLSLDTLALNGDDAEVLAKALKRMTCMHELHLPGNEFGPGGARVLADALPELSDLNVLELRQTLLEDEGVGALAGVLPLMPALRRIGLQGCDVSVAAEGALLRAALPGLESLHL